MHFGWQPPPITIKDGRTIRLDSLKKLAWYANGEVQK
jgi:hypothetical protein